MGGYEEVLNLLVLLVEQTEGDLRSLEAALAAGNFAQIREKAHTIKGASGNAAADKLRELAASLEGRMINGEHDRLEVLVAEVMAEFARVRAYIEDYRRTPDEAGT
jgi:HPt (histidine-containing phosphotransfer) domain-containing protein